MRNEASVNVHDRTIHTRHRVLRPAGSQQGTLEPPDGIESLPYLEDIVAVAKRHPYAALGAMITVAGIVIAAVVTIAVSIFSGMFLMYGTMRETTAKQDQIQQTLTAIQKQQTDDMNAVRAYASNNARRNEFIVGLMSRESQRAIAEWDQANPRPELPGVQNNQPRKE